MEVTESVVNQVTSIEPFALRSFCEEAVADLSCIRSGILICIQDPRSIGELDTSVRDLRALRLNARNIGLADIEQLCSQCELVITDLSKDPNETFDREARRALDLLAEIEAALLKVPLADGDLLPDISDFLDESFEKLTQGAQSSYVQTEPDDQEEFEIDDETLEIFRSEAAELLENISDNIQVLATRPDDRDALWNIRRCAHTFKGAAGIVGMKEASELAHRVEDLLDQLAENRYKIDDAVIGLLTVSTDYLNAKATGTGTGARKELAAIYAEFGRVIPENNGRAARSEPAFPQCVPPEVNKVECDKNDPVKPPPTSIVRVSLDRLDELLNITQNLATNRSALAERFSEIATFNKNDRSGSDSYEKLGSLFESYRSLTNEMQEKLRQIRMVKFGMLTTRLNRAVHVTCQEENKKARVVIDNEDVEIDTVILDALVEPLLHLLRNAVVHGIESPETRRMIGKDENGQIRIGIKNHDEQIVVTISDDGRGISAVKLREKAVSSGQISPETADGLTDEEAIDLMFLRGVTTADTLNLNAGRGVGMSIVKESIESTGGSVSIATEPQKGTTFTIRAPIFSGSEPFEMVEDNKCSNMEQSADLCVLIVDDSASMRQGTAKMIEKVGWNVLTATDGVDAIEILGDIENRPDIILTDLEMPRQNGFDLLQELKSTEELRGIPVIMITSRSDEAYRQKAFDLGAADFLTKPVDEKTLMAAINQHSVVTATVS